MRVSNSTIRPMYALWLRELLRFFRQKSRIIGVLLTPFVFWLILGTGFGEAFQFAQGDMEQTYLEFFFPGIIVLVLLFASIFSNISLIEDRHEGFFQNVLVAPVTSSGIVLGKILGSVTIALIQVLIFLLISPFIGFQLNFFIVFLFVVFCALLATGLSALGFVIAWRIDSIQGFHAIMNVVLIPLWLLSGSVFPAESAAPFIQWVISVNPVGYGVDLLRSLFVEGGALGDSTSVSSISLGVIVTFSVLLVIMAILSVKRTRES